MTFAGFIARSAFVASLFVSAAPAWASEEEGGLPQFDVGTFPSQLFWLAVCFGVLYMLMSSMIVPRFRDTQENRRKVIASEIEAAKVAHESARHTVDELEKSLAKARAEAMDHVNEMMAEVNEESASHLLSKEKEIQRKMNRVEADIAVAREEALNAVRANATDLAATIAAKISGVNVRVAP